MTLAYYNEFDKTAANWLRNLIAAGEIAPGHVDDRSIKDVRAVDLVGYRQCHFFAGIGGWSRAARIAEWPDHRRLWTGSPPCQPFSVAGKQLGGGRRARPVARLLPPHPRCTAGCRRGRAGCGSDSARMARPNAR